MRLRRKDVFEQGAVGCPGPQTSNTGGFEPLFNHWIRAESFKPGYSCDKAVGRESKEHTFLQLFHNLGFKSCPPQHWGNPSMPIWDSADISMKRGAWKRYGFFGTTSLKRWKYLLCATLTAFIIVFYPLGFSQPAKSAEIPATDAAEVWLAQAVPAQVRVQDIPVVGMTVSDMDNAIAFYSNVLKFQVISDIETHGRAVELLQGVFGARMRVVRMQLGTEVIELTEYLTPRGRPIPVDSRSNDLWFQHIAIVVSDMDAAYTRLREFDVQHVSTGPQKLPETIPAAVGIEAFYFQDPDGHNLEVIFYPEGKDNPRWQENNGELFLGIDHTAIGVSDTEASLEFYRDLLGLELLGESFNFGTEQEHLNNVFGARLHISGLGVGQGMAVEFLEYLSPSTGRPYPADSLPNDLWHWDITMVVADATAAAEHLEQAGVPFISSGPVDLTESMFDFRRGFLVRDPDGHAIRIIEN